MLRRAGLCLEDNVPHPISVVVGINNTPGTGVYGKEKMMLELVSVKQTVPNVWCQWEE